MSSHKGSKNLDIILAIGVIAVVVILVFVGQSLYVAKNESNNKTINTENTTQESTKKKVCLESDEDCLFAGCNGFY